MGKYLIYRINEGLSIIPTETRHLLGFIAVGEDIRNQGYALIYGVRSINQTFPCWGATARGKLVRANKPMV